jgi:hypothetical protein
MAQRELGPEDFEKIREAVMETARGRWFLDQYASRVRSRESQSLTASMKRLETALSANHDAVMARLAAALDRGTPRPAPHAAEPELSARHMKYYRDDEDIFEPAPSSHASAMPDLALLQGLPPQPAADTGPDIEPKRRIFIIRHKPGEEIDVPLADDFAKAS